MPNTSKSSKKATPTTKAAANTDFVDVFSPVIVNTVEQVADLQKKTLDVAAEQTAQWIGAWKQAFSFFPVTPPAFIFEVAGQAVQTAIENQKNAIDLVVEQTKSATEITKVRADAYAKIAAGVKSSVKQSVERSVAAQKNVLDFASQQNKAVFESAKKQFSSVPGPATLIVDSFQRGTDAVIDAQKSALDFASQQFLANAKN
jgi:hypothetical protein